MVQGKMSQKSDEILEEYIRTIGDIWEWRTRQWLSKFLGTLEKEFVKDKSSERK